LRVGLATTNWLMGFESSSEECRRRNLKGRCGRTESADNVANPPTLGMQNHLTLRRDTKDFAKPGIEEHLAVVR